MFVEATVPAGRTAVIPIEVFISRGLADQSVEALLADLGQAPNGSWIALGPEEAAGLDGLASARNWARLSQDVIEVPAGQSGTTELRVALPTVASGTYLVAVLLRSRPLAAEDAAVRIQFEFLVPVVLTVEGRPVRQDVRIDSVAMELATDPRGRPVSTLGRVGIANRGRSFSRFTGTVQIDRLSGETWRRVTRYPLPERAIIPGIELRLDRDIERRLPAGQYRMRADITVDGRRVPPLQREFHFAGDPAIDVTAYDTELELDPPALDLAALPGGTRTNIVAITNPSDRPVEVEVAARTPAPLQGVAAAGLRGDALSAAGWTAIRPERFTLGPRQRRNVRLLAELPRSAPPAPWFYADIVLRGTYPDGQSAGETRTALQMRRQDIAETRDAAFERIAVVRGDDGDGHVLTVRVANIGTAHLRPELTMMLISEAGIRHAFTALEGAPGPLLPLGLRDHAAEVDLGAVPDGEYLLRVDLRDGDGTPIHNRQERARVGSGPGGRSLELVSGVR